MKAKSVKAADVTKAPHNGELLLSYWVRIGGTFDGGFLKTARRAAESHGFYMERARLFSSRQMTLNI